MKDTDIKFIIKKEINFFLVYWLMKIVDLMGWGATAAVIRPKILRLAGFNIGKDTRIMTGVMIHTSLAPLSIGEGTYINKNVYFDVGNAPVKIGKYCDIGFNAVFSNARHTLQSNFKTRRGHENNLPINIEDFVWIGCNSTILGGVTVGRGSVIAVGSVIVNDVPPNTIVAGVPARILKEIPK